jgi:hypothetical protein
MGRPNPMVVYHGCDQGAAASIRANGVDPMLGRPRTDFARGFYVTTNLHQAKNWANQRVRRLRSTAAATAAVLEFHIDRNALAAAPDCVFLLDSPDFWALVTQCRTAMPGPAPAHGFEAVWGPVALWPQQLVIAACDQLSVHSRSIAGRLLSLQMPPISPLHGPLF